MRLSRLLVFLAALFAASSAFPQAATLTAGPTTNGHVPVFVQGGYGQPIVRDGGGSDGSSPGVSANPSELGITAISPTNAYPSASSGNGPNGEHQCMFDAPITNPTGYHYLCFDPNAQGGGLIDYGSGGVASLLPLQIKVNGQLYAFPFTLSGIVGPATTTVGDMACWNNATGSMQKDCGVPIPVVPSNTALRALVAGYAPQVWRSGFAAAGDAPPLLFTWQASCPGTPDNAALYVAPNSTSSGCWSSAYDPNVEDFREWGALCNNSHDDQPAIQAEVNAFGAYGGKRIRVTAGACKIGATISVPYNDIHFFGIGENTSTIVPTGGFDAFVFGDIANATVSHVGMRDLSIVWATIPASGHCFRVNHVYYPVVHNVLCQNPYAGAAIGPSYFGEYDNVRFFSSYTGGSFGDGLTLYGDKNTIGSGTHPVSNNFNDWYFLSPVGGAFEHVVGISSAEHTHFANLYINGANTNDILMQVQDPSVATSPDIQNTTFDTIYSDNNAVAMGCGIYINGNGNGNIVDTKISNLIAAGEVPFVASGITQGLCINANAPSQVAETKIVNANVYDWQASGINIQSATDTQLTNVKSQNNNALNTTAGVGLDIGPNVRGLIATNLRAGGTTYGASLQTYGVYIEGGAQNVVIDGGDVTGNVTAGVQNNNSVTTTPSTITISNMIGFNGGRTPVTFTPASNVQQCNPYNAPATVQVFGGTVSVIMLNSASFNSTTSAIFTLGAQDCITLTYTGSPTALWWPQ